MRSESFKRVGNDSLINDRDRDVRSAFAELLIPFLDDAQLLGRHLDLSLAGRYDDYNDFGDTFNPQAGIAWQPTRAFTVRAAYARAFRAPALSDLGETGTFIYIDDVVDPQSPTGRSPLLIVNGDNPLLKPEKARTWSVGFDFQPAFLAGAQVSLSYFNVDYKGRISEPALLNERGLALEREERYPGLILRNPTAEQLDAVIATDLDGISNFTLIDWTPGTPLLNDFPNIVVFDDVTKNIAAESVRALDLTFDGEFTAGAGTLSYGLNGTYTLEYERTDATNADATGRFISVQFIQRW